MMLLLAGASFASSTIVALLANIGARRSYRAIAMRDGVARGRAKLAIFIFFVPVTMNQMMTTRFVMIYDLAFARSTSLATATRVA